MRWMEKEMGKQKGCGEVGVEEVRGGKGER